MLLLDSVNLTTAAQLPPASMLGWGWGRGTEWPEHRDLVGAGLLYLKGAQTQLIQDPRPRPAFPQQYHQQPQEVKCVPLVRRSARVAPDPDHCRLTTPEDLLVAGQGFIYPSSTKPNWQLLSGKALELQFSVGGEGRGSWRNITQQPLHDRPFPTQIPQSPPLSAQPQVGGTASSLTKPQSEYNRIFQVQTSRAEHSCNL